MRGLGSQSGRISRWCGCWTTRSRRAASRSRNSRWCNEGSCGRAGTSGSRPCRATPLFGVHAVRAGPWRILQLTDVLYSSIRYTCSKRLLVGAGADADRGSPILQMDAALVRPVAHAYDRVGSGMIRELVHYAIPCLVLADEAAPLELVPHRMRVRRIHRAHVRVLVRQIRREATQID